MKFRSGFLCLLLGVAAAIAADGIPARPSAGNYTAHQISGKIAIGAAYVTPAQAKKIFGTDLDKRGYVVFEVGMFPDGGTADISADDFKLRQGKDPSVARATTPHTIAGDDNPQQPMGRQPRLPGNVNVETASTIGYESGPYGHGVYTATAVGVGVGKDPNAPPPPPPSTVGGSDRAALEQKLSDNSLPETKTARPVAGYVYFPKPAADKRADFQLIYFGMDGQVTLTLPATAK